MNFIDWSVQKRRKHWFQHLVVTGIYFNYFCYSCYKIRKLLCNMCIVARVCCPPILVVRDYVPDKIKYHVHV